MIIYPPELQVRDGRARVCARFEAEGKEDVLWFEVESKYAGYIVTDRIDAFLVGLLMLAMRLREDIELRHPVSERTFFNLDQGLMRIINRAFPEFEPVAIKHSGFAGKLETSGERVVATGLSCGVDSLFTVAMNSSPDVPPSYKITHVVFANVGSHGRTDQAEGMERFQGRLRNSQMCAQELGLELIVIDSNMEQILSKVTDYDRTLTFRIASAVLVLEKLIRRYLQSSGVSYKALKFRKKAKDSAPFEPMTLPCLCTDSLEFILFGARYNKTEKIEIISDFTPSYKHLNVCGIQAKNCGHCTKCMRTMITLDVMGNLDRYATEFDMERYRQGKYRYLAHAKASRKRRIMHQELVDLMEREGYRPPGWFHLYYPGYLVLFRCAMAGRAITEYMYDSMKKVPRMQRSIVIAPLRFVFFRLAKIVDNEA